MQKQMSLARQKREAQLLYLARVYAGHSLTLSEHVNKLMQNPANAISFGRELERMMYIELTTQTFSRDKELQITALLRQLAQLLFGLEYHPSNAPPPGNTYGDLNTIVERFLASIS